MRRSDRRRVPARVAAPAVEDLWQRVRGLKSRAERDRTGTFYTEGVRSLCRVADRGLPIDCLVVPGCDLGDLRRAHQGGKPGAGIDLDRVMNRQHGRQQRGNPLIRPLRLSLDVFDEGSVVDII